MFDILLGWRKASKCKNLVRLVQCRLKFLKIKRDTIVRQLRDDIAHLLNNGHIDAAFSRVEQLFKDQGLLAAYDLLGHFCEFIIIHFPYIRKHKKCPDDINEAVSTLLFAAAWCGDLPELKSIQKLFAERYGHKFAKAAVGLYPGNLVNNQIKEKLVVKSIPDEAKVRLIDEIAKEYSLLNLSKYCGHNECQWEGFVFKDEPEVNYSSLKGQQILAPCYKDKLTERAVKLIIETLQVGTMHKSAAKLESCNLVGSSNQSEMKLSTFPLEDSFQFQDNSVNFKQVQEFQFSTVKDECDEDKRAFLFFDSSISPLGDCSTFGRASCCSLKHPCNYGVMNFHGECLQFGGTEVSDFPGSCTSWCCSCSKGCHERTVTTENNLQSASSEFQYSKKSKTSWHTHVHPKLPDYDEVAAKFMALKKEHKQRTAP